MKIFFHFYFRLSTFQSVKIFSKVFENISAYNFLSASQLLHFGAFLPHTKNIFKGLLMLPTVSKSA